MPNQRSALLRAFSRPVEIDSHAWPVAFRCDLVVQHEVHNLNLAQLVDRGRDAVRRRVATSACPGPLGFAWLKWLTVQAVGPPMLMGQVCPASTSGAEVCIMRSPGRLHRLAEGADIRC